MQDYLYFATNDAMHSLCERLFGEKAEAFDAPVLARELIKTDPSVKREYYLIAVHFINNEKRVAPSVFGIPVDRARARLALWNHLFDTEEGPAYRWKISAS